MVRSPCWNSLPLPTKAERWFPVLYVFVVTLIERVRRNVANIVLPNPVDVEQGSESLVPLAPWCSHLVSWRWLDAVKKKFKKNDNNSSFPVFFSFSFGRLLTSQNMEGGWNRQAQRIFGEGEEWRLGRASHIIFHRGGTRRRGSCCRLQVWPVQGVMKSVLF